MRTLIAMFAGAGLATAAALAGCTGAPPEVMVAKSPIVADAGTEHRHPYRDFTHVSVTIGLTGAETFSNAVTVNPATFKGGGGATTTWNLYGSPKVSRDGKRLTLVYVAKRPPNPGGGVTDQVAGTGTIQIDTNDPTTSTTTTTSVPVVPIDTDPCP
jgi:hypothetical protein